MCAKQIEVIKNENRSGSQTFRIMVRGLVQPFSLKFYERTNAVNVGRMVCLVKAMYLKCCERSDPCVTAFSTSKNL